MPHPTRLLSLSVSDSPGMWAGLGFTVVDGAVQIGSTRIVCNGSESEPADGPRGITAWTLSVDGGALPATIDGLVTMAVSEGADPTGLAPRHTNGVVAIDHLVVMTPDVDRTVANFEGLGLECRRRREGAAYGSQTMRQAFFWLGDPDDPNDRVILELVGPSEVDPAKADGDAKFFGLALTCDDLANTAAFFGDLMKPPSEAVQAGRQIATLSSRAGLGVALAFMSPHPA